MATLTDFIPEARLREHHEVTTPATAARALELARHFDLARSPIVQTLFWLRTIPERLRPTDHIVPSPALRIDAIGRTGRGFLVLEDSPERLIVGAVGRFWQSDITFASVTAESFAAFAEPGWAKVAWQLSAEPHPAGSRLHFDLALTATDDEAWRKVSLYFRVLGPFSRFIRSHELRLIARELGGELDPDARRTLAGDEWIPNPKASSTDTVVIDAAPAEVWPWLVQMGCQRGGWYSYDLLDNGGVPSAPVIRPELQQLQLGDVLPATPESKEGFSVLALEPPRTLVLGILRDNERDRTLPMDAVKPEYYWQTSWAFVLEPSGDRQTRLLVRVRADYAPDDSSTRFRARALSLVHHFMESAQLRNLKARAEGRAAAAAAPVPDALESAWGAAGMLFNLMTPFLRDVRCRWGLMQAEADRAHAGDGLVPEPRWQWTHALDIAAPPEAVWPWVAQMGQDKGGFYSYQTLENLVGCNIHNADRIHPEWQSPNPGDPLRLHPHAPALEVREVAPNQHLLVCAGMDPTTGIAPDGRDGRRYVAVSWLFQLEALPGGRTRLISRYRCACSGDFATLLGYGPYIAEAVGFMMDRRMLIGIQERAESEAAPKQNAEQGASR